MLESFQMQSTYGTIRGTLPSELGQLQSLITLQMGDMMLEGSIPAQIFSPSNNLMILDLSNNNLNGSIDSQIGYSENLMALYLGHNTLTGTLPQEIESCVSLKHLYLHDNLFTGPLPRNLPQGLVEIRFDRNAFTGTLPLDSFASMSSLRILFADRNHLNGTIDDEFSHTESLEQINLAHNEFTGPLPIIRDHSIITSIVLRENSFDFVREMSFSSTPSLLYLDLSHQHSEKIELDPRAFAGIRSETQFAFTGCEIHTLPEGVFYGRRDTRLDLSYLKLQTIDANAFEGTWNLNLDLTGNYITTLDPTSFPDGTARGTWHIPQILRNNTLSYHCTLEYDEYCLY